MKTEPVSICAGCAEHAGMFLPLVTATAVFVALALPPTATAQDAAAGAVAGRVINAATGQYLRNATISVEGTSVSTVSESGGVFVLTGVPEGSARITASYTGLDPATVEVAVARGQTARTEIALTSREYDEVLVLGEFAITGEREGNAKAIMDQRNAENMIKVIASDSFGKVPENNVGEFLKLMPGVAIDYVEADVRAIRIRGYNPKYTSVMIDGSRVAMAGSSTIGTGRTFEFEQLSISSVETVELTKTPTPDQPSTAAGTVNLRSKSAFDHKGRRLDYTAFLTFNSEALTLGKTYGWDDGEHYKVRPNIAFEYSDVLIPDKLGVVVGASRSDVYSTQRHVWFSGYDFDSDPANNATEVPRARSDVWFQHGLRPTVRENANLRLDYRFTPELSAWLRFDYNTFDNLSLNRNFRMNIPNNSATAGTVNSPGGPVVPGVEYSLRSQTIHGGTWQITNQGTGRHKYGYTGIVNGAVEFRREALLVTAQFQYSRARNYYDALANGWFDNSVASSAPLNWSWTRESPASPDNITFTQLSGADARDPVNYAFDNNSFTDVERGSKDQIWSGRLDARYKLNLGDVPTTLKAGVSSTLNVRDVWRRDSLQYMLVGADGVANSGDNDRPEDWIETGFDSDWGYGGNANGLPVFNRHALGRHYHAHPDYFTVNTTQHLQRALQNMWDFKEQIDGAYLQSIFTFGRLDLSPGIRYEDTTSWGKGVHDIGDAAARRAVNPADPGAVSSSSEAYIVARYGGRLTAEEKYDSVLGYLHGSYKLRDNVLLRASYHSAITRADIQNLIPGVSSVDETNLTLRSSNPDLRPERSRNFNVSVEYYFEPVGVITVGWFHSQIDDLQRTINNLPIAGTYLEEVYPGYTLSIVENVEDSSTSGFEIDYVQQLSFLPGHLKGLGVFGNYTRLHFDDWANYTDSPKSTWNAGVSYALGRLQAQVRANYNGRALADVRADGWNAYNRKRLRFDLSVSYRLQANLSVFLNGRNITDEPLGNYRGRKGAWERFARFGSFWECGVKGAF